ncbi:MAG: hypothetical protein V2A69_16000 [Pseudomonadota bacterium]
MTAEELGRHLGYSDPRVGVIHVYNRYAEKFENIKDTSVLKLSTTRKPNKARGGGDDIKQTRIFSERGALKLIRYSDTVKADQIMDEVFDVFLKTRQMIQNSLITSEQLKAKFIVEKPAPWEQLWGKELLQAISTMYGHGEYWMGKRDGAIRGFINTFANRQAPPCVYAEIRRRQEIVNCKHHQFYTPEARNWAGKHHQLLFGLIVGSGYNVARFKKAFYRLFPKNQDHWQDSIRAGDIWLELEDQTENRQLNFLFGESS